MGVDVSRFMLGMVCLVGETEICSVPQLAYAYLCTCAPVSEGKHTEGSRLFPPTCVW